MVHARRWRKWFRFNLLALFGLVTAVGVFLGWYVNRPHRLLDGYCPVTLLETEQWLPGKPQYSATFMGAKYFFVGAREHDMFVANPEKYAAALSGYDVVLARDKGDRVVGERRHGLFYEGKVYLFCGEKTLEKFSQQPTPYMTFASKAGERH